MKCLEINGRFPSLESVLEVQHTAFSLFRFLEMSDIKNLSQTSAGIRNLVCSSFHDFRIPCRKVWVKAPLTYSPRCFGCLGPLKNQEKDRDYAFMTEPWVVTTNCKLHNNQDCIKRARKKSMRNNMEVLIQLRKYLCRKSPNNAYSLFFQAYNLFQESIKNPSWEQESMFYDKVNKVHKAVVWEAQDAESKRSDKNKMPHYARSRKMTQIWFIYK
jgi:hypothetical protein